jgi:hypothetical protein
MQQLRTRFCKKKYERTAMRVRQLKFKEENGLINPDELIELMKLKEQLEAFENIKPSERNKDKPKYNNRPRMA